MDGAVVGAVEPLTDINIYDILLFVGTNAYNRLVEIPQREKQWLNLTST